MTKDEVLAMKPGRELDALVAEHVFSWRKVPGPTTDYGGPCESFDVLVPPTIDDPYPLYPPRGVIKPWYFCRNWSTEISTAWEVVDKLENECAIAISTFRGETLCTMCEARQDGDFYEFESALVPEAICKAALIAKIGGLVV